MKFPLALIALQLCTGCIMLADKGDYADYREVRLAHNTEARALAMQRYVQRHPSGHWHDQIQETRKHDDAAAFEAGKDTRAGLEQYMLAYPDGAFIAQARGRLSAIALIKQRSQLAQHQADEAADARKARTDELRRTWVGRFIGYWTQTLTGMHAWGEPIADVARGNPQFSRAFAAQPRPRCTQEECLKYYTSQFAVPVPGGTRIERTLSLVLRLRMKNNKLERAELLLPERGFSRWYELENRRTIADGDAEGRAAAVKWAFDRALPLVTALGESFVSVREKNPVNIERPTIGATGELTDTSIEAPSDPQNRASDPPDNTGIGALVQAKPEPTVNDLVKPSDEPAPDMVFAPVGVSKQGQRVAAAPGPAAPAAASGATPMQAPGDVMVIDPIAVPKTDAAQSTPPSAAAVTPATPATPSAATSTVLAPVVKAFQGSGSHIVLFAAGAEGNGYDGLIVERGVAASAVAKPRAVAPPRAPPPAVAPTPPAH